MSMLLIELPRDILFLIFKQLSPLALQRFAATSRMAHQLAYEFLALQLSAPSPTRFFYRLFDAPVLRELQYSIFHTLVPWMQQMQRQPGVYPLHRVELESFISSPFKIKRMLEQHASNWGTGLDLPWDVYSPEIQREWLVQLTADFQRKHPGRQLVESGAVFANMQRSDPSLDTVRAVLNTMLKRYTEVEVAEVLVQGTTLKELIEILQDYYKRYVHQQLQREFVQNLDIVPADKKVFKNAIKRQNWFLVAQQLRNGVLLNTAALWTDLIKVETWERGVQLFLLADADPNVVFQYRGKTYTLLHHAMCLGRLDILRQLVHFGAALNVRDENGVTPLTMTVQWQTCTEYLLEQGANVLDGAGRTVLHTIAATGVEYPHNLDPNWIKKLISQYHVPVNAQDIRGETALYLAVVGQKYQLAMMLLENGASLASMVGFGDGDTPIHVLVNKKENIETAAFEFIQHCLERYPDMLTIVNAKGNTLLHDAVRFNHREVVLALLAKGASLLVKNNKGQTPMHFIPKSGVMPELIARYLAENGDWNAIDSDGNNLLHHAVQIGNVEWIRILLAQGADARLQNHAGKTPIEMQYVFGRRLSRTNRHLSETEYKTLVNLEMTKIRMQHYLSPPPVAVLFSQTPHSKRVCLVLNVSQYHERFMALFQESRSPRLSLWAEYAPGEGPCTREVAEAYATACVAELEREFRVLIPK